MHTIKTKLLFTAFSLFSQLFLFQLRSQNYTMSPYSMFGIGEATTGTNGENPGMGGTGIGKPSDGAINLANPASLGTLDSMTFYFDIGITGSRSTYKAKGNTESTTDGNFNSLAMGFKPSRRWAIAFGFLPVSSVGYNIKSSNYIEGSTTTEDVWFQGSGGLSKAFITNAFRITPGITAGISTALVFGTINHDELQDAITINHKSQTNAFYPEFGITYQPELNNNRPFSFGVVYAPRTKLKMDSQLEVFDNSGYLLSTESPSVSDKYLPECFGIGFSFNINEKLNMAADYLHHDWSLSQTGQTGYAYTNTNKMAMGLEYLPNPRNALRYFKKINYRAGFSVENSYLKIGETNPIIYKTTLGMGLPIRQGSMLNLSMAWEQNNASGSGIINQSTFRISLGLAFTEPWFYKRKFD